MVRIKRGNVARKRRKKILSMASGYRGAHSVLFRVANQQVMKALRYSYICLLYTSPSPRDRTRSRMPSSA